MPKRKPRKPYRGILTVPAPKCDPELSPSDNALVGTISRIQKLGALVDHYSVIERFKVQQGDNESKWLFLAYCLAMDHVPGFAPSPSKRLQGRKSNPQVVAADVALFLELGKTEEDGKSVKNRTLQLTKSDNPHFKGKNPDTLRERYYKKLKDLNSPESKRMQLVARIAYGRELPEQFIAEHLFGEKKRKL